MATVDEATPDHDHIGPPALLMSKLHAPAVRDQTISRDRLLERLRARSGYRLSLIACPAGFGKTTLLASWHEVEATQKPVAWVSLDEGDNDPVVLWSYAIEALRRVCPAIGRTLSPATVGAARIVDVLLPRLMNELEDQDGIALIFDDFHRLTSGAAADSVAWFVDHVPSTCQLVLATRTEPALPLATLRAHGELLELRSDDLQFTPEEADAFLNGRLALGLTPEDVDALVRRTEGWPAGLYLAALALRGGADRHAFVHRFGASSRHVVDFLVEEVIKVHDPETQAFMFRSSVLDRLSGPLCDAVLEAQGSSGRLSALSRTNLFLVPLDDLGEWYRFHHLFAQLLRLEFAQREPGLSPTLHRRASVWHRDHGTTEEAIHHALEAGMFAEAAELIEASWPYYANMCRHASVLAWLQRLPDEVLRADARLLLVKAWVLSYAVRREEAARAIAAIEELGVAGEGPLPDGFSSVESSLTSLRASFPWGDVGAQLTHGLRAAELEGPGSPRRSVACWAVGMGYYYQGRYEDADPWFEETIALANENWLVAGSALAHRSLIAGEQGRHDEQRLLAAQATQLAREHTIDEIDGEVPLALGASLAARGMPEQALGPIERAVAVLRSWGQPIDLAHGLLHEASVLHSLGQRQRGEVVIAEVRSILDTCSDPGILRQRLKAIEPVPRARGAGPAGDELTEAELRVLRLLSGPLTEREIGHELYLSHNTVHSHARSIYQKLGASSRAQVLEEARRRGLLPRTGAPFT
jgi:LuxR family maltose regulon positive regulatory protein